MEIEGRRDEAIAAYHRSVELGKRPGAHYLGNWSAYRLHVLTSEPREAFERLKMLMENPKQAGMQESQGFFSEAALLLGIPPTAASASTSPQPGKRE